MLKVMSFNTQHCLNFRTRKIDFEIMAETVKSLGADIVGLNEIHGGGWDPEFLEQTEILSELTGLKYHFFAPALTLPQGFYGNAFISRIPIVSAEKIFIPDPEVRPEGRGYETRCVIKARLENGLWVIVTHFGLNPDEQQNAAATVEGLLEEEKCVLMGDFNVNPDNPVLDGIRRRMFDTAELFKEPLLSFRSDIPRRKIDYIFTSPDVPVLSADIPAIIASDHRPHVATLDI